jgi:hypothetical protein
LQRILRHQVFQTVKFQHGYSRVTVGKSAILP